MFGGRVYNQNGQALLPASGQCYVLWKTVSVGAGADAEHKVGLGIVRGSVPTPIIFVRSTQWFGNWNGVERLSYGWLYTRTVPGQEYIIHSFDTRATAWVFMPADWVAARDPKQNWGVRFYGEDGKPTYVGTRKPLQIATLYKYPRLDPIPDVSLGSASLAILIGPSGYHNTWQSNQYQYCVYRTLYNGRLKSYCDLIDSEGYPQSATDLPIPCIDTSLY